jgi:hypothetical protein
MLRRRRQATCDKLCTRTTCRSTNDRPNTAYAATSLWPRRPDTSCPKQVFAFCFSSSSSHERFLTTRPRAPPLKRKPNWSPRPALLYPHTTRELLCLGASALSTSSTALLLERARQHPSSRYLLPKPSSASCPSPSKALATLSATTSLRLAPAPAAVTRDARAGILSRHFHFLRMASYTHIPHHELVSSDPARSGALLAPPSRPLA